MNDNVYLRAFEYSDLGLLNTIRNDTNLFRTTGGNKYYISSEYDKKWIEDKMFNNYEQLYLVICSREIENPLGYICATNIDYINRKAEWGGIVLNSEISSRGVATEAGHLLLNHLFGELGMNMVYAYVKEDNLASIRIGEKLGFKNDGLIRDFVYKQSRFYNAYIFTLLKCDYDNKLKESSSLILTSQSEVR